MYLIHVLVSVQTSLPTTSSSSCSASPTRDRRTSLWSLWTLLSVTHRYKKHRTTFDFSGSTSTNKMMRSQQQSIALQLFVTLWSVGPRQDYQFYIQNFTALQLGTVVPSGRQATFEYSFIPAEPMGGRPFGLVINLNYKDSNVRILYAYPQRLIVIPAAVLRSSIKWWFLSCRLDGLKCFWSDSKPYLWSDSCWFKSRFHLVNPHTVSHFYSLYCNVVSVTFCTFDQKLVIFVRYVSSILVGLKSLKLNCRLFFKPTCQRQSSTMIKERRVTGISVLLFLSHHFLQHLPVGVWPLTFLHCLLFLLSRLSLILPFLSVVAFILLTSLFLFSLLPPLFLFFFPSFFFSL